MPALEGLEWGRLGMLAAGIVVVVLVLVLLTKQCSGSSAQSKNSDYMSQVQAVLKTSDGAGASLSQLLHSGSPNNNGDWSNATFDRLVDQADTLPPNDPKRLKLYRQAEQLAMNQAAVIPLANPTTGILVRQSIHGLVVRGGQLLAPDWTRVTIAGSSVQ